MSPLSTQSLKNLLELTVMISSCISFLSKYTTEQITADNFGVKTAFRTNTVSQTSVDELHLKIHSLSLLFKVRDTLLSLCPRSQERERVQTDGTSSVLRARLSQSLCCSLAGIRVPSGQTQFLPQASVSSISSHSTAEPKSVSSTSPSAILSSHPPF